MTALRAAAQQALEALEFYKGCYGASQAEEAIITALRAALAEPVQEPIGYLWPTGRHPEFRFTQQKRDGVDGTPVYTAPPKRKPLTEEEIEAVCAPLGFAKLSPVEVARAIERAHGIGGEA